MAAITSTMAMLQMLAGDVEAPECHICRVRHSSVLFITPPRKPSDPLQIAA